MSPGIHRLRPLALPAALFAGTLAWLWGWVFGLGPALINDEYAAIDYFYRMVRTGGFYPTPDKLHKPLSVLFGFFAWAAESPLGYEAATAVFAAGFITALFLAARRELGRWPGLAAALLIALHPDLVYYTVTGSTVMPFCFLACVGLYAALRRGEGRKWMWVYAVAFLLAGLLRPEAWLFAAPLVIWWRPANWRDLRGWIPVLAAGAIIELGPVIWFGKDWLINGDFLHGMKVAVRDKTVGMGAPYSALTVTNFFRVRTANIVSWPVALGGVVGLGWLWRARGLRAALTHPFFIFPALVSGYVWLIVYQGVYPVQRYWYFDAVFLVLLCVFLAARLLERADREAAPSQGLFAACVLGGVGGALAGGTGGPLLAGGLFALAAAQLIAWPRRILQPAVSLAPVAAVAFLALSFGFFSLGYYGREVEELRLEAAKQAEMVEAVKFLRPRLAPDERLLLSSRRNEQFSWLLRDRDVPSVVFFREAYYLRYYGRISDFLELHPDWILYSQGDFQFFGPQDVFAWLSNQDHTTLRGVNIDLEFSTPHLRLFRVTYPPGFPPRAPLPPIP